MIVVAAERPKMWGAERPAEKDGADVVNKVRAEGLAVTYFNVRMKAGAPRPVFPFVNK